MLCYRRLEFGSRPLRFRATRLCVWILLGSSAWPAHSTAQDIAADRQSMPDQIEVAPAQSADAVEGETAPEEQFSPEKLSPEIRALVDQFSDASDRWAHSLMEMRRVMILHNNNEDRSDEAEQRYRLARDRARSEMNEVFKVAEQLFTARPGDFHAGSMMATVLEYRHGSSIYEDSWRAAKQLLEAKLDYPFLFLVGARSAFIEGEFDEVLPFYEALVDAHGIDVLKPIDHNLAGIIEEYPSWWADELQRREREATADDLPRLRLNTTRGPVVIELFEDEAPNTVANFIHLAEDGFYDGLDFYQVIDDFIAMCGDPVGDGSGTSGRYLPDEYNEENPRRIFRGSLVMAKINDESDEKKYVPNSASSQFAIALMPLVRPNQTQTVFGRVIEGIDVVCSFNRLDPSAKKEKSVQLPPDRILSVDLIRKRPHDYSVRYVGDAVTSGGG